MERFSPLHWFFATPIVTVCAEKPYFVAFLQRSGRLSTDLVNICPGIARNLPTCDRVQMYNLS
jgi:hypothetical protein